jgi:hypothetical protein
MIQKRVAIIEGGWNGVVGPLTLQNCVLLVPSYKYHVQISTDIIVKIKQSTVPDGVKAQLIQTGTSHLLPSIQDKEANSC